MFFLLALACTPVDPSADGDSASLDTAAVEDSATEQDSAEQVETADTEDSETFEEAPAFSEVFDALESTCGGCHTSPYIGAFIDSDDVQATWSLLLNGVPQADPQARYVVPGDPDRSLLMDKLAAEPGFGDTMPPPQGYVSPLEPAQVDLIRLWIAAGAEGP